MQRDVGMITLLGNHSVNETVARFRALLDERHVTLFAFIDHSGEAAKIGMNMPPTKLLIFGNPKGGTPLMLAAPTTAIDLPLKLLVWQGTSHPRSFKYRPLRALSSSSGSSLGLRAKLGQKKWTR